jgi:prevent-host-death family protein
MYTSIGAFDAKATLSKLLQDVQRGHCFTITLRGLPIADLVPIKETFHQNASAAVEAMRNVSKIRGISGEKVCEWIAEGRR